VICILLFSVSVVLIIVNEWNHFVQQKAGESLGAANEDQTLLGTVKLFKLF